MLPAMELSGELCSVRTTCLVSPYFLCVPTLTCHNMPTDNNLNFTQVYSTNLYQENTRVSTLTAVGKIARLAWFARRPYSVLGPRLRMNVDGDAYINYNIN